MLRAMVRTSLVLALLGGPTVALAQMAIEEVRAERHFAVGARGAGMADNYVAEIYDVSGMYGNPAVLPMLDRHDVLVDFFADTDNDFSRVSAVAPLEVGGTAVLAAGLYAEHAMDRAEDRLALKYGEYGVDVAGGFSPARAFSVGLRVGARLATDATRSGPAGVWALGVCYSPTPKLSYAAAYQGGRDGFLYLYDPADASTAMTPMPLTHALLTGLTLRLPDRRTYSHIVALSLQADYVFHGPSKGTVFGGGLEVRPWEFLSLRVGYRTGRDVEHARYGVGVEMGIVKIDYALSPARTEPRFHQVTVLIGIGEVAESSTCR